MPLWSSVAAFRRHRLLTPAEYAWATSVFGDTLPPRERIRVSPAVGRHRRPFTFPSPGRRATVFLGAHERDPVATAPALFAHELTHVWQLGHARHVLPWLANAVVVQLRFSLGTNVYDVGDGTRPWADYNVEQQAALVERWVAHRDDAEGRRLEHHLDDHVRTAPPLS